MLAWSMVLVSWCLAWSSPILFSEMAFGFTPPQPTWQVNTPTRKHVVFAESKALDSSTTTHSNLEVAPGILGPPEPLRSLPLGTSIRAFRPMTTSTTFTNGNDEETKRHDFEIERLAMDPPIFYLRGVLTMEECESLCQSATHMAPAETVTEGDTTSRTHCQVAWLSNMWTQSLARSLGNLFLSREVKTHSQSGVEDLQILEYGPGGEFILHIDGTPRVLTILYYLNGVGETWFPLADDTRCPERPRNKQEALEQCRDLVAGKDGLTIGGGRSISIHPGDAVAFYNYLDDGSGHVNWNSLHAGLPVQGDTSKWVANHWFCHGALKESEA